MNKMQYIEPQGTDLKSVPDQVRRAYRHEQDAVY